MKKKWMLLENNKEQTDQMCRLIQNNFTEVELLHADNLKDAYEIIFNHTIDLFIVDVVLDEKNETDISGIQFIRNIRDIVRYIFAPVIYVTSLTDIELSVYKDPNCMGYVRIPYREDKLKSMLTNALKYKTPHKNREVLYMRNEKGLYSLNVEDILYIEYVNGISEIHMINRNVESVPGVPCKQSIEDLDSMNLVQCSRNIIVNRFYIKSIDKSKRKIMLRGDDIELPVGPSFLKRVWDRVYKS